MLATLVAALLSTTSGPEVSSQPPPTPVADVPRLSVLTDAGLPDGVGVTLGFRPVRWVRLEAGLIGNGLSLGARGGVSLIPFRSVFRPTLTVEGGYFFPAEGAGVLQDQVPEELVSMIQGLRYDYGSAQLGFEVGSQNIAFFLRLGVSYLRAEAPGLSQAASALGATASTVRVRALMPSARLGVAFSFL